MAVPKPYDEEIGNLICEIISTSNKSLATIIKENNNVPKMTTIFKWLNENETFAKNYAHAKDNQADFLAEEIIEIADDSSQDIERIDEYGNRIENKEFINRSRLRVDARKWIASKLKPKRYADKLELSGEIKGNSKIRVIMGKKKDSENQTDD